MFDKVFKPNASQEKVYNEAAKSIVKGKVLNISGFKSFIGSRVKIDISPISFQNEKLKFFWPQIQKILAKIILNEVIFKSKGPF